MFQNGGQYNTYKHEMKIETEIGTYMGMNFLIPKIWLILKPFTGIFHQA